MQVNKSVQHWKKKQNSMITNILFDFSRVILFPKDENYKGMLNDLYRKIIEEKSPFLSYFKFNEELLDFLKPLKEKYHLSIYTTDIIQKDPEVKKILDPIFEEIFAANDLGISKKDPQGYLVIASKLNVKPEQILFIDDGEINIQAAKQAGLQTIRYLSNEQLFNCLESMLFA